MTVCTGRLWFNAARGKAMRIHEPPEPIKLPRWCTTALDTCCRLARRLACPACVTLLVIDGAPAHAGAEEPWPARPLRVIVPYGVGGSYDAIARVMASQLSDQLGQQLIIDNRAGAAGRIGMEMAVKAPP